MQEDDKEVEARLRERLRALDRDALELVYDRFFLPIFKYVSFRINDQQTVEDLTSEVFTRLLASLHKGRVPEKLQAWLFGVANNVVIDHYRATNKASWSQISEQMASTAASPDEQTDFALLRDKLRKGLHKLNPDQQHVLALRFGYGMPIKEVADQMGKSIGAVKMLQARAVAALSREVDE